jgi:hypothetical protein
VIAACENHEDLALQLSIVLKSLGRDAARGGLEQSEVERQTATLPASSLGRAEPPAAGSSNGAAAQPVACREGCGKQFGSALAEMGHLRHCPVRLERRRRSAAAEP